MKRTGIALGGVLFAAGVPLFTSTGCLSSFGTRPDPARMAKRAVNARYEDGRFVNIDAPPRKDWASFGTLKEMLFGDQVRTPPGPLPLVDPRRIWATTPATGLRVTWLGHSTLLLEVDGVRVLTDPIWSERASPSTLVGPARFHPPPVPLEDLPRLDAVVISHDHYDHLDMATIEALNAREVPFFVPLGVADHLLQWGVPAERIIELDWWNEAPVPGTAVTLTATPAQHFSGRGLTDRNATLWASWVLNSGARRIFFSGDTGLTKQFEEVGRRLGPFDLVMLEVGAFHPSWGDIHLGPDNAIEAHRMLGGGPLLPIHWSTFNLALHAWDEPMERLAGLAARHGVPLMTPRPGEPIEVGGSTRVVHWWREVTAPAEGDEATQISEASLDM